MALAYPPGSFVDFSKLGDPIDSYIKGRDKAKEWDMEEQRKALFADGIPQDAQGRPDYVKVAAGLASIGDMKGLRDFASLADTQEQRQYQRGRDDREFGFREREAAASRGERADDRTLRAEEIRENRGFRRDMFDWQRQKDTRDFGYRGERDATGDRFREREFGLRSDEVKTNQGYRGRELDMREAESASTIASRTRDANRRDADADPNVRGSTAAQRAAMTDYYKEGGPRASALSRSQTKTQEQLTIEAERLIGANNKRIDQAIAAVQSTALLTPDAKQQEILRLEGNRKLYAASLYQRLGMNPDGSSRAPAAQKPAEISMRGKGTQDTPYEPTTQAEYDEIEAGTYYIHPSDGRLRLKK